MNVDAAVPSAYLPPGFYAASASCSADGILSENTTSGEISNAVGTVQRSTFDCQALPKCEVEFFNIFLFYFFLFAVYYCCTIHWQ